MPTFYNFRENGVDYSFDDIFVPADIFREGNLLIWGHNQNQKLGVNDNSNRSTPITTFSGGANWKQVSSGLRHSGGIKTDGTLWMWGRNNYGQLGNLAAGQYGTPVTTFAGGTNWKQLACGGYHTAAIKTDGTLWTWGHNGNTTFSKGPGQLGTNDTINRNTPVTTFAGGNNWKQVSCNKYNVEFTAAIKTDGSLWTWGNGTNGQLGIGDAPSSFRLTPITTFAGGNNWADTATGAADELYTISAGGRMSSAIKTDGTLWVWGNNYSGELGNADAGSGKYSSTPITTFAGGTNWAQVSVANNAGSYSTAAIKTDGTLWVWGRGRYGGLGIPDYNNRTRQSTPITTFVGGSNWKQVSNGGNILVAVKTDGTLWNWGRGAFERFGRGESIKSTPVTTFAGGTNWDDTATGAADELYTISAGGDHSAAIKTDGTLWVWGSNYDQQLGNNSKIPSATPITTFAGGTNWKQVSCPTRLSTNNSSYTAAIKTDGTLWVWGSSNTSQLGASPSPTPTTTFAGGNNWKQISCGGFHTAAVKTDGTLWTWGRNLFCELGVNDRSQRPTPVTTFAGGTDWDQVSTSEYTTAGIKTDGTLWMWGSNTQGHLGTGDYTNRSTPVTTFAGGTNWKQISLGFRVTAAIKTDGTLWTWGPANQGRLGTNDSTPVRTTPVTTFAGGTNWKQVSTSGYHTAAVKTDGTLWVWGNATHGKLGNGDTSGYSNSRTPITTFAGGTNWKQVSCSEIATIALKDDGVNKELYVWGDDKAFNQSRDAGPLGINIESTRLPGQVFGSSADWDTVSGYQGDHTAAIKTDGTLWTWGSGSQGKLGTNDNTTRFTPTTTFAGGSNWKQVTGGDSYTAAIKTDGTLWIWGYGQFCRLGTNDVNINRLTPVTTFAGGTNWKQVNGGDSHTAAIKTDGTLWVWGSNTQGQLGTGDTTTRSTPVTTFAGGTNWKQVSSGSFSTIALEDDGVNKSLYVWGNRISGLLGIDDLIFSTPSQESTNSYDWKQVSCGGFHTAAVKNDGTLWNWGANSIRQLAQGYGDNANRFTPVTTFAGGTDWKQVSAGFRHSGAIKNDGTLWMWGSNGYNGALGNNQIGSTRATPITTFAGGNNWKQISLGGNGTTAIKTDGTLWTWGNNSVGQLGVNSTTAKYTPVTTFAGGTNWKQVSLAFDHILAATYNDYMV